METGTYRAVHRGVRNMRIRYILKLMLDDIFQKKIMIILLLAMSSISIYMTDVIATRYFSNQYRINSMSSMFAVNPDKVNYVKYLNLMSPEYTPQIGDELIQYIRNYQGVVACGRFNNNKMILNGELVKTLVIEKDIANMGNLLLDSDNLQSIKNGSENVAYVGYSYRNEYKTGIQFNYYEENEKSSCEIAGYLKKGASWPLKGKLFGGVSDIDSYNLDNTIVVITPNYEYFDNIGGMPDTPYYIVDDETVADKLKMDIVEWAAERNLGVSVLNEADEIANEKELRNITADSSFSAEVLLFLLALISMSSAAIVSCLLNRQHMGIMVACGVSKRSIMVINYMENVFVVLIPEIIIWLICQKNIFGKVFMNNISELDMIKYGDWFSHCIAVPIMYLAELVIVTVIAGIVPMFIISRMKVAEVIKPVD